MHLTHVRPSGLSRRVAPALLVLALAGCSREAPATPEEQGTAPADQPAAAAVSSPVDQSAAAGIKPVPAELPEVLARVNGEDISRADFEKALSNLEARAGGPVPDSERDRIYRGVLDELIGYTLLLQESRTRKVTVNEADVEAQLNQLRQQFPPEDFKRMLAERKLTERDVRNEMRNDMLVGRLLETALASKVAVAEADIAAFYKENQNQFEMPEQVRASHILIAVPKGATAEEKAAALKTATSVLERAKKGEDFAALAREHSQDPGSAANGGDLGYFQQGQMVGPFNDAAFRLASGDISGIVETEFGYHIIKVLDKQPGRRVTLDEARPRIQEYLESEKRRTEMQNFVESLRSKGRIEVFI